MSINIPTSDSSLPYVVERWCCRPHVHLSISKLGGKKVTGKLMIPRIKTLLVPPPAKSPYYYFC